MMMAQNSSPPPPQGLAEETVARLRSALREYLQNPDERSGVLRPALETVAIDARRQGMLPEAVLVSLKDVWYALPEVQHLPEGPVQVHLLQRVVTMCIKEYYSR